MIDLAVKNKTNRIAVNFNFKSTWRYDKYYIKKTIYRILKVIIIQFNKQFVFFLLLCLIEHSNQNQHWFKKICVIY